MSDLAGMVVVGFLCGPIVGVAAALALYACGIRIS